MSNTDASTASSDKPNRHGARRLMVLSLLCLLVSAALVVSLLFSIYGGRGDVVASFAQPSSVQYDGSTYSARVETAGNDPFTFGEDGHFQLQIGRSADYGARLDITVLVRNGESRTDLIRQAYPVWTDEGLRLTLANGQEFFVPSLLFTGGR